MGRVAGKKLFSIIALCAMISLLLLPIAVSLPSLAIGADAPDAVKKEGEAKVEKGRDVYYKTEGIVVGAPAPKTVDGPKDYPRYNFESRVLLWFANQQHLYYGSFVLAVPIFCMVIEFMGMTTKDKAMAKKYDQLAYDFIKISLTAYSITAILGGILIFTFLTLAQAGVDPIVTPSSIPAKSSSLGDPLSPGSLRGYMLVYRDPNDSPIPCAGPGAHFNATNGLKVYWAP